ncbi:MAG: hypothetical protein V2A58_16085 [Planctomycetota bacterium]
MPQLDPPLILEDNFVERRNVAWRIEEGLWDPHNPLIPCEHPWESACSFNAGTVLKDPSDGLWKAWGITWPHVENFRRGQFYTHLVYATSEDGVRWKKPQLDGFPCMGRSKTNVLFAPEHMGRFYYASVILRDDVPPNERYELFLHAAPFVHNPSGHAKGFPILPGHEDRHPSGIYRFSSPDGIHWNPVEGPLPLSSADSIYIFREPDGSYVSYHKIGRTAHPGAYVPYDVGAGGQRILVRRTSPDGRQWSPYEIIIEPDWRDAHDTQFMDLGIIREPQGVVAIVAVYRVLSERMDFEFAGSPDGRNWFRPFPRTPCLRNRPLGDCGGGLFYAGPRLVPDGDKLHFYFSALEGLHGDVYGKVDDEYLQYGSLCRATWERGRLWAAVPAAAGPTIALLSTRTLPDIRGKELVVNALALEGGSLTAELASPDWEGAPGEPEPGFSFADSLPFRGNEKAHVIKWKGGTRAPRNGLMLRFSLRSARLYGFGWR